jgi:hypothetical protein
MAKITPMILGSIYIQASHSYLTGIFMELVYFHYFFQNICEQFNQLKWEDLNETIFLAQYPDSSDHLDRWMFITSQKIS